MSQEQSLVVQYVGFQTGLDEDTFIQTWTPFASSIKSAGISEVDIFALQQKDVLSYISRNIWPAEAYFKNFPTGIAGAARAKDMMVLQFGGYWMKEEEREQPSDMLLLFQRQFVEVDEKVFSRHEAVSKQVPFEQLLVIENAKSTYASTNEQFAFYCKHLKSL